MGGLEEERGNKREFEKGRWLRRKGEVWRA